MSLRSRLSAWQQDPLFIHVLRNSGYLLSSNTVSMVLTSLQGILAAVLLGPSEYGLLGMVILFASSVNRLLSFRMGEVVIKYAGQELAKGHRQEAAAVVKMAALTEAATSVIAYALLVLMAPLAAKYILKDTQTTNYIIIYGLALLANLVAETSTALLQLGDHFRGQALVTLAQSVLTAGIILAAFLLKAGFNLVLAAYLAGKVLNGLGMLFLALRRAGKTLGEGWHRAPLSLVQERRKLAGFAISTNLSGTINMVIRDSEVLWVGFFLSSLEAGYYKFSLAIMNIIVMPVTPLINTTFPQISSSVARNEWKPLRRLLRKTSLLALAWTLACAAGILLLGRPLLSWLKQGAYLPSLPAILILLVGYGVGNVLFWNRPLLLSLGLPNEPLKATAVIGALKTGLMFLLVRPLGYLAQAALLSGYFTVSMVWVVMRGLLELHQREKTSAGENPAT